MTKREYKAVLRAVIRANYYPLNPSPRVYWLAAFNLAGYEIQAAPIERRTEEGYKINLLHRCKAFAPVWQYRRPFVDKLAALFADCDEDCKESYAEHSVLVKYALSHGRVKYSELVEKYTPERFASDEERAAFNRFAWQLHAICHDLYWEFGVALSAYVGR